MNCSHYGIGQWFFFAPFRVFPGFSPYSRHNSLALSPSVRCNLCPKNVENLEGVRIDVSSNSETRNGEKGIQPGIIVGELWLSVLGSWALNLGSVQLFPFSSLQSNNEKERKEMKIKAQKRIILSRLICYEIQPHFCLFASFLSPWIIQIRKIVKYRQLLWCVLSPFINVIQIQH